MTKTRKAESEALEQARGRLQAIIGEVEAVKVHLRAVADDLVATEHQVVVETDDDGDTYTVEQWVSEGLGNTPRADLGGTVREDLDRVLSRLADLADFEGVRQEIHDFQ